MEAWWLAASFAAFLVAIGLETEDPTSWRLISRALTYALGGIAMWLGRSGLGWVSA